MKLKIPKSSIPENYKINVYKLNDANLICF